MTGQELLTALRADILNDTIQGYLWSDAELLRFLNYAEVQACRRAHLIIDGSTAADAGTAATASTAGQKPLCTLNLVAGQAEYTLSPKIIQVRRCQLYSMSYPLRGPLTYQQLDAHMPGWKGTGGIIGTAGVGGYPTAYVNEPGSSIIMVPAPYVNDAANLVVSRLPLFPFGLESSPEIDLRYHEGLLNGAAERAYLKRDSDCYNPEMSKYYGELFTREFGILPDAYSERMRKVLSQNQGVQARVFGS